MFSTPLIQDGVMVADAQLFRLLLTTFTAALAHGRTLSAAALCNLRLAFLGFCFYYFVVPC